MGGLEVWAGAVGAAGGGCSEDLKYTCLVFILHAINIPLLLEKRKRGERFLGLTVRLSPETVWILPAPSLPL